MQSPSNTKQYAFGSLDEIPMGNKGLLYHRTPISNVMLYMKGERKWDSPETNMNEMNKRVIKDVIEFITIEKDLFKMTMIISKR